MKNVVTLAIKDLRLMTRDWMGMFFIVGWPIIMGVVFGIIGASFASEPESASINIAVVDQDDSEMSRRFIEALSGADVLSVRHLTQEQAADRVRRGKLLGFVMIPPGFGETAGIFWAKGPALQLGLDPSRVAEAGMLEGHIMQAMGELVQQRFRDPSGMRPQLQQAIAEIDSGTDLSPSQQTLLKGMLGTVDRFLGSLGEYTDVLEPGPGEGGPSLELARIEKVDVVAPRGKHSEVAAKLRSHWDISFPAAIMWGVMACVAGFAITIAKERTEGTFFRLRIAPIRNIHILGGKALACFFAVLGVIAFMMILGRMLGIQLARPGLLICGGFCVALGFSGLMMLISVIGRTEQAVSGAGWALVVIMCMFGGGMMPLAFMPAWMQTLSHFSPVKWGIYALEGAIWRGFTLAEMLPPCGILLGGGAVCFAVGASLLSRTET